MSDRSGNPIDDAERDKPAVRTDDAPLSGLTRPEIRERASAGIFVTASSGVVLLVIGFLGTVILARLLTPRDFGLVAIGATVIFFTSAVSEGGLASGLIRRPAPPTGNELRTLAGIQLVFTGALTLCVGAAVLPFGEAGAVTALMLCSLPLSALQAPGKVVLTRQLLFTRLALVELGASTAYYAWSIAVVALGGGVWGLATGTVVKGVVSTVGVGVASPTGVPVPTLAGARRFGDLIRFGLKFQAVFLAVTVRDQILNLLALTGGVSTLGLWSLARRLLELPTVIMNSIFRVAYPTIAHILADGEDPRGLIERASRFSAVTMALVLAPFAASSIGVVPAVFGAQWSDVAWVIPPAALGLMLGAPLNGVLGAYLDAAGLPGVVLRIETVAALVWIGASAATLPAAGVAALGIGWAAFGACESLLFDRAARATGNVRALAPAWLPALPAVAGGAIGIWVATLGDSPLMAGIAGGAVATVITFIGLTIVCPRDLAETVTTLWRSVRDAARVRLSSASA